VDEPLLSRLWLHAFEEDADGSLVYRPDGFRMPLARGRGSLDLTRKSEGGVRAAGPADRPVPVTSHWRLAGDMLEFSTDEGRTFVPRLKIISLAADKLVLKKM
jgi:hypothetical protein